MAGTGGKCVAISLALALVAPAACVTTVIEEEAPAALPVDIVPVIVPISGPGGGRGPVDDYYRSVLGQMQSALTDRDVGVLRALVEGHRERSAPEWARQRIEHFVAALLGLEFECFLAEHSSVSMAEDHPIGAPLDCRLAVEPPSGRDVEPVDAGVPLRFLVRIEVVDHDAFGNQSNRSSSLILSVDDRDRKDRRVWEIPFGVELPAGNAVIRDLALRVELLPGHLTVDGRRTAVQRVVVFDRDYTNYPLGVAPIREKPLSTLERAIELGDSKHFPHQFLATHFLPAADRDAAARLLIGEVRLGSGDQARVGMACLRALTGESISIADRDSWLEWWQAKGDRR